MSGPLPGMKVCRHVGNPDTCEACYFDATDAEIKTSTAADKAVARQINEETRLTVAMRAAVEELER